MTDSSSTPDHAPPRPPKLPSQKGNAVFAWLLIVLAVAGSVIGNMRSEEAEEKNDAGGSGSLGILQLQSSVLIGLDLLYDNLQGNRAQAQLVSQIDGLAKNFDADQERAALSAVRLFVAPEDMDGAEAMLGEGKASAAVAEAIAGNADLADLEAAGLGWFATVLKGALGGKDSPAYKEVSTVGWKAVIGYLAFLGIGGLLFLIGLALLFFAFLRSQAKRFPLRFDRSRPYSLLLLEGFGVYMASFVAFQWLASLGRLPMFSSIALMLFAVGLGIFWPVFRGVPLSKLPGLLGLHRGAGFGKELFSGIVGYIAMIPLFVVGVIITAFLQFLLQALGVEARQPSHPIVDWISNGNTMLVVLSFVLAAIGAPLMEETMFRGAMYRGLRRYSGIIVSGLVMGFIFAIVHPQGLIAIPPLMLLGLGFGLIREWRDSLIGPMFAHGLHNGALVLLMSSIL